MSLPDWSFFSQVLGVKKSLANSIKQWNLSAKLQAKWLSLTLKWIILILLNLEKVYEISQQWIRQLSVYSLKNYICYLDSANVKTKMGGKKQKFGKEINDWFGERSENLGRER